jgi:RHS repeat-associated protein
LVHLGLLVLVLASGLAAAAEPPAHWLRRLSLEAWELSFDHDGDGFSSAHEFDFGTDPLDAGSQPYAWVETTNGLVLELTFVPGIAHRLDSSTDLIDFEPVEVGPLPPDATALLRFDAVEKQRFFRFAVPPHPDTDGDCLLDFEELSVYGTDPGRSDTDADGLSDCDEVNVFASDPSYASPTGRGRIQGTVVLDEDGDPGTREHPGVADWAVYLDLDRDGRWGPNDRAALTDADGWFEFDELDPGSYRVGLETRAGWLQVFPASVPPPSPDGYPDRIERLEDAGTGPIPWPYGFNVSNPVRTLQLGRTPESVDPAVILGPPPRSPVSAPVGSWSDVDFLSISSNSAVTVEFTAEEIFDGPGPDLVLISLSQTGTEEAEVYVGAAPDRLTFARRITENASLDIDLAELGITTPVYFVRVKALDNRGTSPGFDLVGFEALHYRLRDRSFYEVIVDGGQTVTNIDFGVAGDDRPPRLFLSYEPAGPRAGQPLDVTVLASDDVGLTEVTFTAGGAAQVLGTNRVVRVTPPGPGLFDLVATATDTAGQTETTVLPLLIAHADGSLPDLSGLNLETVGDTGAPSIRISSPVAGQILDGPTDVIGSLLPGLLPLDSWRMEYALADRVNPQALNDEDPDYVRLASGTGPVSGAVVGTVPADTLPAGAYLLRFTATGGATTRHAFVVGVGVEPEDIRPVITLTAPAPEAALSYLTEIRGSITSRQELREWSVEYALASSVNLENLGAAGPVWTRIGQGTNTVTDAALAILDPTRLANDSYIVRVTAWNRNGLGWTEPLPVEIIGAAKLGHFAVTFTDLTLPLAGVPITVQRAYHSLTADRPGDFGYGWTLAVQDADLRETIPNRGTALIPTPFRVGARVYLNAPDGRRLGFTFRPAVGMASFLGAAWKAVFEPDPGLTGYSLSVPEGDRSFLSIDSSGQASLFFIGLPYNPDTYILTDGLGTRYTYHERDGLRELQDPNGNRVTFSDTAIQHSAGPRLDLVRDAAGRITAITGPEGIVLRYAYSAAGDLVSVEHPSGDTGTFTYAGGRPHFLERIDDPTHGPTQRIEYGADGRVTAVVDAAGNRSVQSWDPGSFTGAYTDGRGFVTEITYDALGNVTREVDPLGGVTQRTYDDARHPHRETAVTDPLGHRTTYTYDDRGNRLTELKPGNRRATGWTYNAANRVTQLAHPTGHLERRTYDAAGRLATLTAPARDFALTYTASGLAATYTDPVGSIYRYEYADAGRRPTRILLPGGAVQQFEYTARGALRRVVDPSGAAHEFVYDTAGRPLRQIDPLGGRVEVSYHPDHPGSLATRTDRNGGVLRFDYDARGALNRVEKPNGAVVRFEYDAAGNRTAFVDPRTNRFESVFDARNRVVTETDPLGRSRHHRYDAAGNRIETVDRNGRKRTFIYDAQNRRTEERWHDPVTDAVIVTNRFAYDPMNRLTELNAPDAVVVPAYGNETAVLTLERARYPGLPERLVSTSREATGQLRAVNFLGNSAFHQRTVDGVVLQIDATMGTDNYQFAWQRNARGEVVRLDRRRVSAPARWVGSSVYPGIDPRGWVTAFEHFRGTNEPIGADVVFTRDAEGQILERVLDGGTNRYTYDPAGQLLRVERDGTTIESYAYDANGNRVTSHRHTTHTTDAANRLLQAGSWSFEYDGEGNRVRKTNGADDWTYEYDHRNRLTRVNLASGANPSSVVAEYRYDLRDRRIAVIQGGVTNWTYYALDHPVAEYVNAETDPAARYVYGEDLDQLLAVWRRGEGVFFPLTDQLGSVTRVLDDAGNEVARFEDDSFGNRLAASGSNTNAVGRFGYTGREYEAATGLYYYRARWYDPDVGRFLTEDPAGLSVCEPNLYRYAANSPLRHRDPTGTVTAIEYAVLQFAERLGTFAALCDLYSDVRDLWAFVAHSVANAVNSGTGPTADEVRSATTGALPNYCDLSPINPGCVADCEAIYK